MSRKQEDYFNNMYMIKHRCRSWIYISAAQSVTSTIFSCVRMGFDKNFISRVFETKRSMALDIGAEELASKNDSYAGG